MDDSIDPALPQRAARGDREAFERVFEYSVPRVWAFALRHAAGRTAAEQQTRRILKRAFGELSSYDGKQPFAQWLSAVASRVESSPSPHAAKPDRRALPRTTRPA
jgi:DNA-directed RNA polymerase specialized sigma24 family protein